MKSIRQVTAVILAIMILVVTATALLSIWDIINIDFRHIFGKFLWSVFVIFIAAVVLLFIFSVVYKVDEKRMEQLNK